MYEKFFALAHRPFAAAPNLECIVTHQGYIDARERLLRCLADGSGMAVLTAPAGLGKSLLCQDVQSRLRGQFTVAYLCSAQFPNRKALLQAILFELGAEYLGLSEDEARLCVIKAAQDATDRGRSLVVIVDEAHLVSTEMLQELRGIAEPTSRCAIPLRLMLSGQLELEERLADPDLEAINQRIACHAILEALSLAESAEYIHERLAIAGAKTAKFSEEAIAFIIKAADGNPRALHQLCDHCLLSAYTIEEKPVSLETARNSLDDLRALPLHWNDAGLSDDSPDPVDDSIEDVSDDEFVSTVDATSGNALTPEPATLSSEAREAAAQFIEQSPFWNDSPLLGVIEVGGAPTPVHSVTDAALFASVAPWPAVPVESIGTSLDDVVAEIVNLPSDLPSMEISPEDADEFDGADSEEDTAIERLSSNSTHFLDALQPQDFDDEELIIDDRYAALDRASETLSTYFPKAPDLLQFLSQYAVKDEPRRSRDVAAPMHQSAIQLAEPETDVHEEELLATIRELQEQLQRASTERSRPVDPAEGWKLGTHATLYDIVEPPVETIAEIAAADPVVHQQELVIEAPVAELVETVTAAEPVRARFAQLFSRMRQRRREVEDRLRKNADWV